MQTFLWGYWGGLNVGDELILKAIVELLGREHIVVVARGDNSYVSKLHDVESVSYTKVLRDVPFNRHIVGGGGLFQDTTSLHNIFYYLFPIVLGRESCLIGVGVGPLQQAMSRVVVSSAFRGITLAVVRDVLSYRFLLQRVGFISTFLAPDITFTLSSLTKHKFSYIYNPGEVLLVPGPSLGLYWKDVVRKTRGKKVVVVEFLPLLDSKWRREYPTSWKVINGIDALFQGELMDIIGKFSFWVVGRLHAMILALLMGKYFYPMVYDIKMKVLLRDLGIITYNKGEYVSINNMRLSQIVKRANDVYGRVAEYLAGKGWVR